ncbi:MAG: hypothetical protein LKE85_06725 [Lachnospiraceae bacterium]|jgi:hypothetical protein|nr:hypothetical protein [Lachnospiraceae bacterium]
MSECESKQGKEEKLRHAKEEILAIRQALLQDPEITESDLWAMEAQWIREEPVKTGNQISGKETTGAPLQKHSMSDGAVETPREAAMRFPVLAPTHDVTKVSREAMQEEAVRRIILRLFS